MEKAFESPFVNCIFDTVLRGITSDRALNLMSRSVSRNMSTKSVMSSTGDVKIDAKNGLMHIMVNTVLRLIDNPLQKLDRRLFEDTLDAYSAFFGQNIPEERRSVMGTYIVWVVKKYLSDWKQTQISKQKILPPTRVLQTGLQTYTGWKTLRDELQPNWKINFLTYYASQTNFGKDKWKGIGESIKDPDVQKNNMQFVKVLDEDLMNPYDRMLGLIKGKGFDRVALGPLFNWAVPYLGGSNFWKFCYDGLETAWAGVNVWLRTGGLDFLPQGFGLAAYTIPWFESHSRFYYEWTYPADFMFPQFIEKEILKSYDDLYAYGMSGLAQRITKRMMRDFILLLRELYYQGKVNKYYYGPIESQFFPYAQLLFASWDILPMWRSMVPFMKDMRKHPDAVLEAFEFINKPMTDFMIAIGKLTKAKSALIGNSRGSNSWVSPKMFQKLFWPSMKYTINKCLDNGIVPFCHFDNDWTENMAFLAENLPKRSCVFHLDQVDLVKVHAITKDMFCLMGAMSPALLVHGSVEQVEAETKRYIENIGEDGLIIASGCEIPADIPIRNLYAQKRAIKKYGFIQ
jgi:hypothetical protein